MTTADKCKHIVKAGILQRENGEPLLWESIYKGLPAGHEPIINIWYNQAIKKIGPPSKKKIVKYLQPS